ncbi:MAG TPA: hypothetical protein VFK87_10685 [Steroidobacteraceae bacterium]|nr:hypothetical protein [Steroidobacteraceae bacterium]
MRGGAPLLALVLVVAGGPVAGAAPDEEAAIRLKDGPGRDLTAGRCAMCHSLEYIPANAPAMDRTGWQKSVQKMRERFGAPISDAEAQAILEYLAGNYAGKS